MRESEQERKSFAYGIKIAPDSRGLVLPWRIFTFQSGAIGKSTSLSHLNSVKPCPAQIGSMDPSMLHQNRCGHIQPIKTQSPLGGGWGWLSLRKSFKNGHNHSAKRVWISSPADYSAPFGCCACCSAHVCPIRILWTLGILWFYEPSNQLI